MLLKDHWYVAAWAHEVTRGLLARRLLGEPVVLYRSTAGDPVALEDRCLHRRAPLSLGRVVGDEVECGYHGLRYDADLLTLAAHTSSAAADRVEVTG